MKTPVPPKELTDDQQFNIFEPLKRTYSDFPEFQKLVSTRLKVAIVEAEEININLSTTKKIAERYYEKKLYTTFDKLVWKKIKQIFRAAYILILYHRTLAKQEKLPKTIGKKAKKPQTLIIWQSVDTLIEEYPSFAGIGENELNLLLKFRNMTKIATMFMQVRLNKQQLLDIAGRLEGSQCTYITGGGQRPEVSRRVAIYEKEGKVVREARPERTAAAKKQRQETPPPAVVAVAPMAVGLRRSRDNSSSSLSTASAATDQASTVSIASSSSNPRKARKALQQPAPPAPEIVEKGTNLGKRKRSNLASEVASTTMPAQLSEPHTHTYPSPKAAKTRGRPPKAVSTTVPSVPPAIKSKAKAKPARISTHTTHRIGPADSVENTAEQPTPLLTPSAPTAFHSTHEVTYITQPHQLQQQQQQQYQHHQQQQQQWPAVSLAVSSSSAAAAALGSELYELALLQAPVFSIPDIDPITGELHHGEKAWVPSGKVIRNAFR